MTTREKMEEVMPMVVLRKSSPYLERKEVMLFCSSAESVSYTHLGAPEIGSDRQMTDFSGVPYQGKVEQTCDRAPFLLSLIHI